MTLANIGSELIDENVSTASSGSYDANGPLAIGKLAVNLINGATAPSTPANVTIKVSQDNTDFLTIVDALEGPSENNGEQHYQVDVSGWKHIEVDISSTSQAVDKLVHLSGIENA